MIPHNVRLYLNGSILDILIAYVLYQISVTFPAMSHPCGTTTIPIRSKYNLDFNPRGGGDDGVLKTMPVKLRPSILCFSFQFVQRYRN